MHMLLVITAGLILALVFGLFGHLWGHGRADIALGLKYFLPVWVLVALLNLWVGVTKAGYTLAQELPILALVIAVPLGIVGLVIWQLGKA